MAKPRESLLAARRRADTAWHGTAFVVEALVLLLFLAFALAMFMQLFGAAHARGVEERALTQAVLLATNSAEEFAAAPAEGAQTAEGEDGLVVEREVTGEKMAGGTLYEAIITVRRDGDEVYRLETSRYASDGAARTRGGDAA
ncbi:hypothetical protein [Arabiibacter massiliensis]|uniref:hypothetical protein n=1 Tax=Arabiibacter massiliensis TaxID=1870985 RepID=UPI0009BC69AF|nr:hypothetical protein [Arabiibacter massiliensis]